MNRVEPGRIVFTTNHAPRVAEISANSSDGGFLGRIKYNQASFKEILAGGRLASRECQFRDETLCTYIQDISVVNPYNDQGLAKNLLVQVMKESGHPLVSIACRSDRVFCSQMEIFCNATSFAENPPEMGATALHPTVFFYQKD